MKDIRKKYKKNEKEETFLKNGKHEKKKHQKHESEVTLNWTTPNSLFYLPPRPTNQIFTKGKSSFLQKELFNVFFLVVSSRTTETRRTRRCKNENGTKTFEKQK